MTLNYIFKLYLGPLRLKMVKNFVLKTILVIFWPQMAQGNNLNYVNLKEIDIP